MKPTRSMANDLSAYGIARSTIQGNPRRGYNERGNINTPMELAIDNGIDRYTLAMRCTHK